MLLKSDRTMETACPRRWPLFAGGGFLAIAIILAGVGFQQAAPADDSKPDETKKSDPKTDPMKTPPTPKPAKPKAADQPPVPIGPFPIPLDGDPEQLGKNIQKMMEEMMKRMQDRGLPGAMIMPFPGGGNDPFAFGRRGSGRLGVTIEKPSDVLVEQLDLPRDQGLVVREVSADSAAAKAGIKANDILLELAGKNVSSDPQEFRKQVGELKSKTAVDAVVLRKGKKETVKGISLPDATANDDAFGRFPFPKEPNMPNIPNLPAPPPLPPPPLVQNFGGKSTSIQIQNDTFTIQSNDEELSISVTGKFGDGKTTVNSVVIRDGNDKVQCDSLESVPEKYRDQVQKLLKSVQKK